MKLLCIFVWSIVSCVAIEQDEAEWCAPENAKFRCRTYQLKDFVHLQLPSGNFKDFTCNEAEGRLSSFVVSEDNRTFTRPNKFTIIDELTENGSVEILDCEREGFPCTCEREKACAGTTPFCEIFQCEVGATCFCSLKKGVSRIVHQATNGQSIDKPKILSLWICDETLSVRKRSRQRNMQRRSLLEVQEFQAIFQKDGLEVKYSEPILTFSAVGTVILRSGQVELIRVIPKSLTVEIPMEFYSGQQKIKVIYISKMGKMVDGSIFPTTRTDECHRIKCFACWEFIAAMECYPYQIKYVVYTGIILLLAVTVMYVKLAVTTIYSVLRSVIFAVRQIYRLLRGLARLALVTGNITGGHLRNTTDRLQNYVENANRNIRIGPNVPIVLIALMFIGVQALDEDCAKNTIVITEDAVCDKITTDLVQDCRIDTDFQVDITAFSQRVCVWFQNKDKSNLFTLRLTLKHGICTWQTSHLYYTMETKFSYIQQLMCGRNTQCMFGRNCSPEQQFDSITTEAKTYPGRVTCDVIPSSKECTYANSTACLHSKQYLIPDHIHTYEVRNIGSKSCSYRLHATKETTKTRSSVQILRAEVQKEGLQEKNENHPVISNRQLADNLIIRLGKPNEAYLQQTSMVGQPNRNLIGSIQANSTFTDHFIFDPDLFNCEIIEDSLVCLQPRDLLKELIKAKDQQLPIVKNMHRFYMEGEELRSEILAIQPLSMQIRLADYGFTVKTQTVCPQLATDQVESQGCYNCKVMVWLYVYASSSCGNGMADVKFDKVTQHTPAINLTETMRRHTIRFFATQRCISENLCLAGRTVQSCKLIHVCFDEPSQWIVERNTTSDMQVNITSPSEFPGGKFKFLNGRALQEASKVLVTLAVIMFVLIFLVTTARTFFGSYRQ